jgi:hypothetical protein
MTGALRRPPAFGARVSALQLQAVPEPGALAALLAAQEGCAAEPDVWRAIPAASLHLTVQPVVDPDETASATEAWRGAATPWLAGIARICAHSPAFYVALDRIVGLGDAIVALGAPPPQLVVLRRQLVRELASQSRLVRELDIAHVTLFRRQPGPPAPAPSPVASAIRMPVSAVRLVEERVYPSLEVEVLQTFVLGHAAGEDQG